MSHRFKLRQMVRLKQTSFIDERASASGIYEVIRLMPADQAGELSYRIRSGALEKAVRESEIRSA